MTARGTGAPAWQPYAQRLADDLAAAGVLRDPAWRRVLAVTPRHLFVPEFYVGGAAGARRTGERYTAASAGYLDLVYSDQTLVTQYLERHGWLWPTSSSTRPSLMAAMLEQLDVRDGMTVLEVGTGTGYNCALLCARLGDRNVTSVDIDPGLACLAVERLRAIGQRPAVAVRDGRGGHPGRAPYDRLIATVAFEEIPPAWADQVRPGGIILADVRPPGVAWAGGLARLTVTSRGVASGPLLDGLDGFMSARPDPATPGVMESPGIDRTAVRERDTRVGGDALLTPGLSLVAWQRLPGLTVYPGTGTVTAVIPDGSWAELGRSAPARLSYGGPGDLWAAVEAAHAAWQRSGCPGTGRFGFSVTPGGQALWLDDPGTAGLEACHSPRA